jgi:predicted small metal-binding protein
MVKEISCINAGFEDCEFLLRSEKEEEVITFAQQHAKNVHNTDAPREHLENILKEV